MSCRLRYYGASDCPDCRNGHRGGARWRPWYIDGIANSNIAVPGLPAGSESVWHLFPVLVDPGSKQAFLGHLKAAGIEAAEHFPVPLFDQPAMAAARYEASGLCPNALRFCGSEVSLPLHPFLAEEECDRVIAACNAWERRGKSLIYNRLD